VKIDVAARKDDGRLLHAATAHMPLLLPLSFGLRTRVGPGNHVLDGSPDPTIRRGNFEGEMGVVKYIGTHFLVICAKTAEPIEMPFGLWARADPRNHELYGVMVPQWEGAILGETDVHCKV